MTVFIDDDFKCYLEPALGRKEVETPFFDGKCRGYIEGYRFVPDGAVWVREDGTIFHGEMASPFIDYSIIATAQEQYEYDQAQMSDMQNALEILGVSP